MRLSLQFPTIVYHEEAQITAPFDADDPVGRNFQSNPQRIAAVVASAKQAGFGWAAINGIAVYVAGARNADALAEVPREDPRTGSSGGGAGSRRRS